MSVKQYPFFSEERYVISLSPWWGYPFMNPLQNYIFFLAKVTVLYLAAQVNYVLAGGDDAVKESLVYFSPELWIDNSVSPCQGVRVSHTQLITAPACAEAASNVLDSGHSIGVLGADMEPVGELKEVRQGISAQGELVMTPANKCDMRRIYPYPVFSEVSGGAKLKAHYLVPENNQPASGQTVSILSNFFGERNVFEVGYYDDGSGLVPAELTLGQDSLPPGAPLSIPGQFRAQFVCVMDNDRICVSLPGWKPEFCEDDSVIPSGCPRLTYLSECARFVPYKPSCIGIFSSPVGSGACHYQGEVCTAEVISDVAEIVKCSHCSTRYEPRTGKYRGCIPVTTAGDKDLMALPTSENAMTLPVPDSTMALLPSMTTFALLKFLSVWLP